jgi:hypothetical protein
MFNPPLFPMEDYQKYEELRKFLGSELWTQELRPKLAAWAQKKADAMDGAKTPADLWDARTAAATAKEALPLIDNALDELRAKLEAQRREPPRAESY